MPQFTAEAEDFRYDWTRWPRPRQPMLPELWAADSRRFWAQPVNGLPVNKVATAKLSDPGVDCAINVSGGAPVWDGASTGQPVQMVTSGAPTTPVLDSSRPWWEILTGTADRPLPLPPVIRLEGDPAAPWDRHWRCIEGSAILHEAWVLRRKPWPFQGFAMSGYARWRLDIPWNAPGQPLGGVVAGGFPHTPLLLRVEELMARRLVGCKFLALPNYAPGKVGPARNGDGTQVGHPLPAGSRLRLSLSALDRIASGYPIGHPKVTVATGLREFGVVLGDKTGRPAGAITCTQDIRFTEGDAGIGLTPLGDLGLRLSDFEVVG